MTAWVVPIPGLLRVAVPQLHVQFAADGGHCLRHVILTLAWATGGFRGGYQEAIKAENPGSSIAYTYRAGFIRLGDPEPQCSWVAHEKNKGLWIFSRMRGSTNLIVSLKNFADCGVSEFWSTPMGGGNGRNKLPSPLGWLANIRAHRGKGLSSSSLRTRIP